MILPALSFALAGFALLALSMHRHARQATLRETANSPRLLRAAGWAALAMSCALHVAGPGWRIAIVEWIGMAAPCAAAVMLALTYRPRMIPLAILPILLLAVLSAAVA